MTHIIFNSYILFSCIVALYSSINKDFPVAFGYNEDFSFLEISQYVLVIVISWLFYVIVYKLFFRGGEVTAVLVNKSNYKFSNNLSKINSIKLFILIQFSLIFYISYSALEFLNNQYDAYFSYVRPLSGKFSHFFLLLQAILPLIVFQLRFFRIISVFMCVFIGFLYAWIDSSRAAIIPLIGILIIFAGNKNWFKLFLTISLMIFYFALSLVARTYEDRLDMQSLFHILLEVFSRGQEILFGTVSYFSAFSIYQFAYVDKVNAGIFGWSDFLYSILPLPSFFWEKIPDYSLWRVDAYRPMGAAAELFRVSGILFFLAFGVIGYLSSKLDAINAPLLKIFIGCIFSIFIVSFFQYNLRTVQWLFYLMFFLIFLNNRFNFE